MRTGSKSGAIATMRPNSQTSEHINRERTGPPAAVLDGCWTPVRTLAEEWRFPSFPPRTLQHSLLAERWELSFRVSDRTCAAPIVDGRGEAKAFNDAPQLVRVELLPVPVHTDAIYLVPQQFRNCILGNILLLQCCRDGVSGGVENFTGSIPPSLRRRLLNHLLSPALRRPNLSAFKAHHRSSLLDRRASTWKSRRPHRTRALCTGMTRLLLCVLSRSVPEASVDGLCRLIRPATPTMFP